MLRLAILLLIVLANSHQMSQSQQNTISTNRTRQQNGDLKSKMDWSQKLRYGKITDYPLDNNESYWNLKGKKLGATYIQEVILD